MIRPELPKGYVPETRMAGLEDFVKDNDIRTVLEIGRQEGFGSTWFFVKSGAEVWSVDISDAQFQAWSLLQNKKYHHIVGNGCYSIPEIDNLNFDMVFIDSSHLYDQTLREIVRWLPHTLKWFVVDDYNYTQANTHSPFDYGWNKTCYKAFCESGLQFQPILATKDYQDVEVPDRNFPGYSKGDTLFFGHKIGGPNEPPMGYKEYERCPSCNFVAYGIAPGGPLNEFQCPRCFKLWKK